MPQVSLKHGLAALILSVALLGCSDPKNQIFDAETGKHITGWLPAQHATYATNGTTSLGEPVPSTDLCTECHGADLTGGASGISCTSCHLGGPTAVHPLSWNPIYLAHGQSLSSGATTIVSCANQYCHGTELTGVASSGPSCDKNAGIGGCHSVPFDPATVICGACHSIPPDGTKFPDRAGKHAKHATSNKISCDICHNGASAYVGKHPTNGSANMNFLTPTYTPKSGGTPTFDAAGKTCRNISCHGGPRTQSAAQAAAGAATPSSAQSTLVSTPDWLSGAITVSTQCTSCHVYGNVEHNSYASGEHYLHVWDPNNGPRPKLICTTCHDTVKLTVNHFTGLSTTAMSPASQTLRDQVRYIGGSCNPSQGGLSGCHTSENW